MSRILWKGSFAALLGFPLLIAQEAPKVKRVPAHSISSIQGQDLFREYCAVCHGTDGKGGGPAATALKSMPSDLTQLAIKNHGKFPERRVQAVLSEEGVNIAAHGSREMPIWGTILRRLGTNEDLGAVRVYNLLKYVESLQAK